MTQPSLFPVPETIRSPLCVYQTHCGHRCELGKPISHRGYVNRELTCTNCGSRGVISASRAIRTARAAA